MSKNNSTTKMASKDIQYFKSEEFVSDLRNLTSRQLVTVKSTLKKYYNIDVNSLLGGK